MITAMGATGRVGGEVVRLLADLDLPVRALTRNPARAVLPPRVEVAAGSADDGQRLLAALDGAHALFAVLVGDVQAQAREVAEAVRRTGRPMRVVLLSSSAVLHPVPHRIGDEHKAAEELLCAVADSWTLLRPGPFHSNALWWARDIGERGAARCLVGNQPIAPIDPADIAAVAVAALTEDGHDGRTYELTGPELLTSEQQVAVLEELLDRTLCFGVASKQEVVDAFAAISGDRGAARTNVEALHSARVPWARTTATARELLGRDPRPFRDWAARNLDRFRATGHFSVEGSSA